MSPTLNNSTNSAVRGRSVSRVSSGNVGAGTRRNGQREGPHSCSSAHGALLVGVTGVVAFGVGTLAAASGAMAAAKRGLVASGVIYCRQRHDSAEWW